MKIHYRVDGDGAPLLVHGFSDSVESWYEYGYTGGLASGHRLLLVDTRGHGECDKPHDPDRYRAAQGSVTSWPCSTPQEWSGRTATWPLHGRWAQTDYAKAKRHPDGLRNLITSGVSPVESHAMRVMASHRCCSRT